MSVRNLDRMFAPRSVALIGASRRERSIGALVAQNLIAGGFAGPLRLVNPKHAELCGRPVYPSVEALPETPDLAVIATPPATVPGIVDALARRGTGAAVVITAFPQRQAGAVGDLTLAMLAAARPALLRILGPNGIGLLVPGIGLNTSFAHLSAKAEDPAFVAQSAALVTAMLDGGATKPRLLPSDLDGRHGRCRFRRCTGLPRPRGGHARDPPLYRGHHRCA